MGKVIEFLGKPGCGKSTLVEQCTPNPEYIIQRMDFKPSDQERELIKSIIQNPLFYNYIKDYPEVNELFVRKLVEMHYKLKRTDDRLAILDEGLLDRITGIPFDREIIVNTAF